MSLDLIYYGQNVGITVPDVALSGDPAVDQAKCIEKGFIGGRIMAIKSVTNPVNGEKSLIITPCDGSTMVPFGTLLNGPGEYATSIGVSGSKKAPVVRAMPMFNVSADCFVPKNSTATPPVEYVEGCELYAAAGADAGKWTPVRSAHADTHAHICGICTHVPTTSEPYLGVAQSF